MWRFVRKCREQHIYLARESDKKDKWIDPIVNEVIFNNQNLTPWLC